MIEPPAIGADRARPLRGRIVPESPLPMDEFLEIVVETWTPPEGDFNDLQRIFAMVDDTREWQEFARIAPDVDGYFEAPRPAGVPTIRLRVEGDYAHGGPFEFEVHGERDPGPRPLEIPITIGAHVTLQFDFGGEASSDEVASLAGDSLALHAVYQPHNGIDPGGIRYKGAATLDASGRAVVRGLPPLHWSVAQDPGNSSDTLLAPFRIPSALSFRAEAGQRITVKVPAERGRQVEGFVRDVAGRPLEGVRVVATGPKGSFAVRRTGSDGHFQFQALPVGRLQLSADAHGFLDRTYDQDESPALLAPPGPIDIVLLRARKLNVLIRTPNGVPAARLLATMTPRNGGAPKRARTDAAGIASFDGLTAVGYSLRADGLARRSEAAMALGLRPSFFDVAPQKTGLVKATDSPNEFLWTISAEVPATAIESGEMLTVELRPVPEIQGRVAGSLAATSPRPAVWIYPTAARSGAIHELLQRGTEGRGALPLDPLHRTFQGPQLPPGSYEAIVTMGRLAHRLEAEHAPRVRMSSPIPFEVGSEPIDLSLAFGPSLHLKGSATFPNGAPLIDVEIQLRRRFGDSSVHLFAAAMTDHEGRYAFDDLDAGTYWLRADPARFSMERAIEVTLVEGRPAGDLDFVAKRLGAVRIGAFDAAGVTVQRPDTLIRDREGHLATFSFIDGDSDWAGAHGPLAPGAYIAVWEKRPSPDSIQWLRERVVVQAGELTEVRLQDSGMGTSTVSGMVLSCGEAVPGATVWVSDSLGLAALGKTDANGRYELSCSTSGRATLGAGDRPSEPLFERLIELTAGPQTEAPITLDSPAAATTPIEASPPILTDRPR